MTDPNGWPDPAKPGYPAKPERDDTDHWLDINGDLIPARWETGKWAWGPMVFAPEVAASDPTFRYHGPCHTPAEVAAHRSASAVLRRLGTLDTVVEHFLRREPPPSRPAYPCPRWRTSDD